jgi:hypothetical protein
MKAINITAFPEDTNQMEAIKAIMKALNIKFEVGSYNPAFVAKIKKSTQEFEDGKVTRVKKKGLQKFLGL